MIIQIQITDPDQVEYLEEVADQNKMSAALYAQNIVTGWLTAQIKGAYVEYAKKQSLTDLKAIVGEPKMIRTEVAKINQIIGSK